MRLTMISLCSLLTALLGACGGSKRSEASVFHGNEKPRIAPPTGDERLLEAVRQGNLAEVQRLASTGANLRARDGLGSSALLLAARKTDDVALARFVLEHAPDLLDAADGAGRTPLSWAAETGHLAILRLLLERGATLEARDHAGQTPFFHAVLGGNVEAATALHARGASLDVQDRYGDTALMMASAKGDAPMVRALLAAGADRKLKNQEGRTALDRAHDDAIRALLRGS